MVVKVMVLTGVAKGEPGLCQVGALQEIAEIATILATTAAYQLHQLKNNWQPYEEIKLFGQN